MWWVKYMLCIYNTRTPFSVSVSVCLAVHILSPWNWKLMCWMGCLWHSFSSFLCFAIQTNFLTMKLMLEGDSGLSYIRQSNLCARLVLFYFVNCSSTAKSALASGLVSIPITNFSSLQIPLQILGLKKQLLLFISGVPWYMLSQQENDFANFVFRLF